MTGGAARKEQWPTCARCGIAILYGPVSVADGIEEPRWVCPDRDECLERLARL